jgi:hypothetical protein
MRRNLDLEDALERRRKASEASPLEIKLLAAQHGLTAGQVRGLLFKCGGDRARLAEEAVKLRQR